MGEVVFNVVEVANDGILSTEKKTEEVLDDLIVSVCSLLINLACSLSWRLTINNALIYLGRRPRSRAGTLLLSTQHNYRARTRECRPGFLLGV